MCSKRAGLVSISISVFASSCGSSHGTTKPVSPGIHRFGGAARSARDDRSPARLSFQQHHSEAFDVRPDLTIRQHEDVGFDDSHPRGIRHVLAPTPSRRADALENLFALEIGIQDRICLVGCSCTRLRVKLG